MTAEGQRAAFADAIRAEHNLTSPRLIEALALVPRDRFLGPGPWTIRSAEMGGAPQLTPTDDPREVHRNVSVAIDASRSLYNGQPGQVASWIDRLAIAPGERVVQIGCATGYFTALIAHVVGPTGRVDAFEIDPDFSARARECLAPWPWVSVHQGDGRSNLPHKADVLIVHAGATHVLDEWLNPIDDGGRLLVPLTCSMPALGSLSKGMLLLASRRGSNWSAALWSMVIIYSLVGLRDESMNAALGDAFMSGRWKEVARLRLDRHERAETCCVHGSTVCLSK